MPPGWNIVKVAAKTAACTQACLGNLDKVNLLNSTNFTQGKAVIIIVMWHYFLLLPSLPLRAIALFHVWFEKKDAVVLNLNPCAP